MATLSQMTQLSKYPNFGAAQPLMVSGNGLSGLNVLTLNPTSSLPLMMMAWVNNDHEVKFYGYENDIKIEATFKPERDISTFEFMRVQLLIDMIMIGSMSQALNSLAVRPIEYLRTHTLERHFVFKVLP